MPDPVRLYLDSSRQSGCPVPPYCEITPAVATQIVTLTDLPGRIAAAEARISELGRAAQRHQHSLTGVRDGERYQYFTSHPTIGGKPIAGADQPATGDDGFSQQRRLLAALRAESAAWPPAARALVAERDRLTAQVASLIGPNGRNYCAAVEAERDKARADLEVARGIACGLRTSLAALAAEVAAHVKPAPGPWCCKPLQEGCDIHNRDGWIASTGTTGDAHAIVTAMNELAGSKADADEMAGLLDKVRDSIDAACYQDGDGGLIAVAQTCVVGNTLMHDIEAALAKHAKRI